MATTWTPKDYTPFFLFDKPTHTEAEIRAEYSRLRDIVSKRAKRMIKAGLKEQGAFLQEMFPTLAKMAEEISAVETANKTLSPKNRRKVPTVGDYLRRGKELVDDRSYSLKGIREIQSHIKSDTGELVPLGDVLPFNDYMQSWRLSAFKQLIISDLAVDYYGDEYQDIGGSFSDFYTLFQAMRNG